MPYCTFRAKRSDLPCGQATFLCAYVKVPGGYGLADLCKDCALAMGAGYRYNEGIRQHDDPKRPGKICPGSGMRPLGDDERPRNEPQQPEAGAP